MSDTVQVTGSKCKKKKKMPSFQESLHVQQVINNEFVDVKCHWRKTG